MKQVKKSMLLLLVLLFSASFVLAGCGSNGDNEGGEQPAATTETTPQDDDKADDSAAADPKEDLKPYKLIMVFPSTPPPDEAQVEEAMNKILTEKINATIDIRPIDWGQWDDKRNLMVASKEPLDIMFTAQWTNHASNVANGAFLDVGDLLQSHGQGILDTLDPAYLDGSKINGKNYGVPTNKELAGQGGVVYRTDVAEELQLDMSNVKTVADLEPILKTVKEKRPDLTPLFLRDGETFNAHYFGNYDFMGDDKIEGVVLKDGDSTTVQARYDIDRYKEMMNIARDFFLKKYINSDAATTQLSTQDAFKTGKVFMTVQPLKPGKDAELAAATDLVGKLKQIEMNERTISTGETSGSMLAISATSADPERAMMFINLLHTDKELNNLLNFGLEGTHYTRNGEIISGTDNTKNYALGAAWMFGSQFLNYVWDSEDPQKWDKFKAFNTGAKQSPALGFTFDPEPVQTEVAAIVNVRRQFNAALDTGSVDPAKQLPEFIDKLKASGVETVIAEKQKQLDAFLAAKN